MKKVLFFFIAISLFLSCKNSEIDSNNSNAFLGQYQSEIFFFGTEPSGVKVYHSYNIAIINTNEATNRVFCIIKINNHYGDINTTSINTEEIKDYAFIHEKKVFYFGDIKFELNDDKSSIQIIHKYKGSFYRNITCKRVL